MPNEGKRFSLRAQLSLAIALIVLLTVALTSVLANALIWRRFERYVSEQQALRIADIVGGLNAQYDPRVGWNDTLVYAAGMYALYNGYIIKVYDENGEVVWDAENHDMTLCAHIMEEISGRMRQWRQSAQGEMVTQRHILSHGSRPVGSVTIRFYGPYFFTDNDFEFLNTLNAALAITAGVALAFAFAAGALLAARIARPIVRTARIAGQIARGDYQIRYQGKASSRELLELVEAINALAGTLYEQERLRKRLTGDVAHELRTPLATVGAHLEAMVDGVWAPTPDRLKNCQEEIARLSDLVSDLEQLAVVESGEMNLRFERVDLAELARSAGRAFELELAKKRLNYLVAGEGEAWGDPGRLGQVLTNLVENAVKYTPEGGRIRVLIRRAPGQAVMEVQDDGVGISEEALPLIFGRFYRVDGSRSRKTGGAGIGLAIVRSIVRAHGGEVEVESQPGRGSRFTVRLPAEPGREGQPRAPS